MPTLHDPVTVTALLLEAAERQESIDAVTQHGDSAWTVEFETGATCVVEFATAPARLVLTAVIGKPAGDRLAEMQSAALSFNLLWDDTGGCRIALDAEDGELLLVQELYPESLESDHAGDLLMGFEALRALWEFIIGEERPAPRPAELQELVQGLRV